MIRAPTTTFVVCVAVWTLVRGVSHADDVHIDAETSFQAYDIRSPGASVLTTRRRLVQTLGATWSRSLGSDDPQRGRRLRVDGSLRLRLDQGFGDTCLLTRELCIRATDASLAGAYQPLASDTDLDAPEAWVHLSGLPFGGSLRVGRQLRIDSTGFARFDGGSARFAPLSWLSAEVWGGALVRRTSVAGSPAFEPEGVIRLDPQGARADPSRPSFFDEPTVTWTAGAVLEVGRPKALRARVGYRETFEAAGLVARRGWVDLTSNPLRWLLVSATGVLDLFDGVLIDGRGRVRVSAPEHVQLEATLERHVPRFDQGSVWAYFDVVPVDEAGWAVRWQPSERLRLGAGLRMRWARFGPGRGTERDVGGDGQARLRVGRFDLTGSAFVWGGALGPVASFSLGLSRRIGRVLDAWAHASAWHFDDRLRAGLYGTSISESAGATLHLSDYTSLGLEAEHAHSRVVGERFRALLALRLEVWR